MMEERQLNLFKNIQNDGKALFEHRHAITIHLDTIIFLCIINVLVLVVSFSIGMEKGRKIAQKSAKPIIKESNIQIVQKRAPIVKKPIIGATVKQKPSKKKQLEVEKEKSQTILDSYVVQLASYSREQLAKSEKKHLDRMGLTAIISKKGKYNVLYVGKFISKEEAEKTKTKLRNRYSDCFVKKL